MNAKRFILTSFVRKLSTNTQTVKTETAQKNVEERFYALNKERTLNLVQLIGRVGQDPKVAGQQVTEKNDAKNEQNVQTTQNDKVQKSSRLVLFSIATNEYQGIDESGQPKFRTDWHRITVVSHRLQEYAQKRVRQGDRIHVTGRLHYDLVRNKSGEPKLVTNVVADDLIFLDKFSEKEEEES